VRSEGFYVNEKSTDTTWDRTSDLNHCATAVPDIGISETWPEEAANAFESEACLVSVETPKNFQQKQFILFT
jgi:hypothetical protein